MNLSAKPPFAPQTEFEVDIFADDQAPTEGEDTADIILPGTEEEYELIVLLAPSAEFNILGDYLQLRRIKRSEAKSTSAKFLVQVTADAMAGQLEALTASFSY